MEEIPPQTVLRPGQRALAAIVFTDVVSFSARMQVDEGRALKLLQRDFGVMREVCRQHQGSVLKTTGERPAGLDAPAGRAVDRLGPGLLALVAGFSNAGALRARLNRQLAEVATAHAALRAALEEKTANAERDVAEFNQAYADSRMNRN
jgi:class 3 adenylate cyclase